MVDLFLPSFLPVFRLLFPADLALAWGNASA